MLRASDNAVARAPAWGTVLAPHAFALEPAALLDAFVNCPPRGFSTWRDRDGTPLFAAPFDLLTTADVRLRQRVRALPGYGRWGALLRPCTLFAGSTVSEYLPLGNSDGAATLPMRLRDQHARRYALVILKDIPQHSPLLRAQDNRAAAP